MTDTDDLRQLSVGYAAAVDTLDGRSFAALFTPDGELWVPDVSVGRAPSICRSGAAELERIPSGLARYHATRHGVGTTTFVVEGDMATGEVIGVAHHLSAPAEPGGPGTDTIWYLRYEDSYRRTPEGWRIARRMLHLRSVEDRPVAHPGPGRLPGRPGTPAR